MGMQEGDRGRFSTRRKRQVMLRLLRGEQLDALSGEVGVTVATLAPWRDRFLAAEESALKSQPEHEPGAEVRRLQAKIGEITMENELLRERARAAELRHGFHPGRSRP